MNAGNAVENETGKEKKKTREQVEGTRELFKALLFCAAAVVLVRSFLFEPFKIPSSSMVPTLEIGDHIFVSKYSYGLSLPFSTVQLTSWGSPERGDVIVFLFPRDESLHYIKRVIGVPGDKVEFKGKDIFINGEEVSKELVKPEALVELGIEPSEGVEFYRERLGDSEHLIRFSKKKHNKMLRIAQVEIIPEGNYFVVGDNRDESYDSRSWGMVPRTNIKGKAQMIWLSLDKEEGWSPIDKIRWSRSGRFIR